VEKDRIVRVFMVAMSQCQPQKRMISIDLTGSFPNLINGPKNDGLWAHTTVLQVMSACTVIKRSHRVVLIMGCTLSPHVLHQAVRRNRRDLTRN
jgi:hypothetical protein